MNNYSAIQVGLGIVKEIEQPLLSPSSHKLKIIYSNNIIFGVIPTVIIDYSKLTRVGVKD